MHRKNNVAVPAIYLVKYKVTVILLAVTRFSIEVTGHFVNSNRFLVEVPELTKFFGKIVWLPQPKIWLLQLEL